MSSPSSVSARLPLIVAAVCGLLVAALIVAFVHVHSVSSQHSKQSKSGFAVSSEQADVVTAAATEAANIITFSRRTFDADFARATNGTTGSLKTDLLGKKALTLTTMTQGKFDLKATVGASAYAGKTDDGKSTLVLVTLNAFKVADSSTGSTASVQRFQMTMVKVGKSWLASNLAAVGIQ